MKIRFFVFIGLLALVLTACRKPIPGHAILQVQMPDQSTVQLNMGMDSYLLLWHGDRQFIIRTEKVHSQSVDLHIVETFYSPDSTAQSTDIVKVISTQLHLRPEEKMNVNENHAEFNFKLKEIVEHRSELTNTCHDNPQCCMSGCNYHLCCSTMTGKCSGESCACETGSTCPDQRPNLSIHDFAKLFSREKLRVSIPFAH